MLARINKLFTDLSAHVSLWVLIVGSSAFAVIWGWAASAAQWLDGYGPIAWVAAATAGAGFFILLSLGYAEARQRLVRASIERRFFDRPDAINPLEVDFRRQRIRIADLVSPIEPKVRGKTFTECEVIGPANVVLLSSGPGTGSMQHCDLTEVCAILVADGAPAINAVIFEDCSFFRCKLHKITLLFPEGAYDWANERLPGMKWLTPPPARPSASV